MSEILQGSGSRVKEHKGAKIQRCSSTTSSQKVALRLSMKEFLEEIVGKLQNVVEMVERRGKDKKFFPASPSPPRREAGTQHREK